MPINYQDKDCFKAVSLKAPNDRSQRLILFQIKNPASLSGKRGPKGLREPDQGWSIFTILFLVKGQTSSGRTGRDPTVKMEVSRFTQRGFFS